MKTYKIVKSISGEEYIEMTSEDGTISFIPMDEANRDYQAYLKSINN